jgi:hypothetical protein
VPGATAEIDGDHLHLRLPSSSATIWVADRP